MSSNPEPLQDYPLIITLPVQWGDMDAFAHVNNTVPIRWFESARIAYLEQSGMSHLMDASGLGPILAAISCDYRRQLVYPDTVDVAARVSRIGRSSMTMDHAVYSHSQSAIAAEGTSTVVIFDYSTNRPTRMPDDVRQACEKLEGKAFE